MPTPLIEAFETIVRTHLAEQAAAMFHGKATARLSFSYNEDGAHMDSFLHYLKREWNAKVESNPHQSLKSAIAKLPLEDGTTMTLEVTEANFLGSFTCVTTQ